MVGRSDMMMTEYHNLPEKTREAEWRDKEGRRLSIRTGDIGRFDKDGFLILLDRSKDVIISGGFNVYPSDIEAELRPSRSSCRGGGHSALVSERWAMTLVGSVVTLRESSSIEALALMDWANARLGKTQRPTILLSLRACRAARLGSFSSANCAISMAIPGGGSVCSASRPGASCRHGGYQFHLAGSPPPCN